MKKDYTHIDKAILEHRKINPVVNEAREVVEYDPELTRSCRVCAAPVPRMRTITCSQHCNLLRLARGIGPRPYNVPARIWGARQQFYREQLEEP